jgi:hypothetical protein
VTKVQIVSTVFEKLEQEAGDRGETSYEYAIQLRLEHNLPVEDTDLIEESEEDLETDINEIKLFKINDDQEMAESAQEEEEEVEYLIETEAISDTEELLQEISTPAEMKADSFDDEEIVQFDDGDDLIFEEVAMEAGESMTMTNNTYDDNIVNHFE